MGWNTSASFVRLRSGALSPARPFVDTFSGRFTPLTVQISSIGPDRNTWCAVVQRYAVHSSLHLQTTNALRDMFRWHLIDIGIDPKLYAGHSFRRGGCQYLFTVLLWDLRTICEWGGWSPDFTTLTIVRYLVSFNDVKRRLVEEDFFFPYLRSGGWCGECGRQCGCKQFVSWWH